MRKLWMALPFFLLLAAGAAAAEEWRFEAAPGGLLEIDLKTGGAVVVRAGEGGAVVREVARRGRDAGKIRLTAEQTPGGVRVRSEYEGTKSGSGSVDVEVTVPARFDVQLSTLGGEVSLSGLEGKFSGRTMGGAIRLRELTGEASLTTMGGGIEVVDSTLDGTVETMGGSILFRNLEGDLKGKTMGGSVRTEGVRRPAAEAGGRAEGPVEITTMGGDVKVADAPQGARLSTMGGDIVVERAARFVRASTMGGNVRVREVDGEVDLSTMGGDVEARLVGAGGDVKMESKGGDLTLTLPAGFAARFDVEVEVATGRGAEIVSDFPLTETRSPGSVRATGQSGAGTHRVVLRTVNGKIRIVQAK